MKKKVIIIFCSIILTAVVSFSVFWTGFKNSYKYSYYQILMAQKNNDAEALLSYFDFDSIVNKIVDVQIEEMKKSLNGNPFASFGISLMENLKPALAEFMKEGVKENFSKNSNELQKVNSIAIIYNICRNKPFENQIMIDKKIDDNTVKVQVCESNKKNCYTFLFQNMNDKWIITGIDLPKNNK